MSTIPNKKVLVLGLPKSGTSTIATMLRMLGYLVTGPNPSIQGHEALQETFSNYEAFQDYPWCFEYPSLLKNKETQVVVLVRDKEGWAKSFKESYGGEHINYLSYKYMKLSKNEPDDVFTTYHSAYYQNVLNFLETHEINYIQISLKKLNWKTLCAFLEKPIPKNILGIPSKVPKVNSKNYTKKGIGFKFNKQVKRNLHRVLGKRYFKLTSFIYKNK